MVIRERIWRKVRYTFSVRLLNISISGALNSTVLLIKLSERPLGACRGGKVPKGRDPISNRRASRDARMHEGGPYEAPYVRDTALSYSCAGVCCHSCSPGRPKRPTGWPRAKPKYNRYKYNRCAKFNNCASKK